MKCLLFSEKNMFCLFGLAVIFSIDVNAQCVGTGNADAVHSNIGVVSPTAALGAANDVGATIDDQFDELVLDLTDVIISGETYTIRWRKNLSTLDNPVFTVEESSDASSWVNADNSPFTETSTAWTNHDFTANTNTRYIKIRTTDFYDVDIDAVTYDCSALCSVTLTQNSESACMDNGTNSNTSDDFFQLTINATNTGGSTQYEVVTGANADGTGGTVLNTGGTNFGTAVTVGTNSNPPFMADGSTQFNITIRAEDNNTCHADYQTNIVSSCSPCSGSPAAGAVTLTKN